MSCLVTGLPLLGPVGPPGVSVINNYKPFQNCHCDITSGRVHPAGEISTLPVGTVHWTADSTVGLPAAL